MIHSIDQYKLTTMFQIHICNPTSHRSWGKIIKMKIRKIAIQFAAFQETHAKQLTMDKRFWWATSVFKYAESLYNGKVGNEETQFGAIPEKLLEVHRSYISNQYQIAMAALKKATEPGLLLDSEKDYTLVYDKHSEIAIKIFSELEDHMALGTVLRFKAELALRNGDIKEAFEAAKLSEKEFSWHGDKQGISTAFRLLGDIAVINGKVIQAIGYFNAALQIAADHNDISTECVIHERIGEAQFWKGNYILAKNHFQKCLELSGGIDQIRMKAKAMGGIGRVEKEQGCYEKSQQLLKESSNLLEKLDDKIEAAMIKFEHAEIQKILFENDWKRKIEAASSSLESNLARCLANHNKLMLSRIMAILWIWRTTSRMSSELRIRM
mmetsp:Transcript_18654/g.61258  ORF Transcript_18654/g.61258 Transcript_18654/m.61258 type:complete len:381 (-) Transcript_18654:1061-2203(-)